MRYLIATVKRSGAHPSHCAQSREVVYAPGMNRTIVLFLALTGCPTESPTPEPSTQGTTEWATATGSTSTGDTWETATVTGAPPDCTPERWEEYTLCRIDVDVSREDALFEACRDTCGGLTGCELKACGYRCSTEKLVAPDIYDCGDEYPECVCSKVSRATYECIDECLLDATECYEGATCTDCGDEVQACFRSCD